ATSHEFSSSCHISWRAIVHPATSMNTTTRRIRDRLLGTGRGAFRGRRREKPRGPHAEARQTIFETDREAAPAVPQAPPKVDRRGLGKVFRRAGDLRNREAVPENLREHLIVEDEVVRVL